YRFFGIEREPGLSDILVGNAEWRDCVRGVADILMGRFEMEDVMAAPGLDNLHIIEAGPIPANPSELLSTPAMTEFLRPVRADAAVAQTDSSTGLGVATLAPPGEVAAPETTGRGRSRTVLLTVVAVLSAVGALAGVVMWRSGGLDAMSPRDLARQRVTPTSPSSVP